MKQKNLFQQKIQVKSRPTASEVSPVEEAAQQFEEERDDCDSVRLAAMMEEESKSSGSVSPVVKEAANRQEEDFDENDNTCDAVERMKTEFHKAGAKLDAVISGHASKPLQMNVKEQQENAETKKKRGRPKKVKSKPLYIDPKNKPRKKKDGSYQQPAGQPLKDYTWDTQLGKYKRNDDFCSNASH